MGNTPESKNLLKERSEPMRKRGKGKGRRICWRGWESGEGIVHHEEHEETRS